MDENTKRRIRLIFNPKDGFPSKLYDVCNDGYLIKWNRNGSVSVTDEADFEAQVMEIYPGFLQIPSFLNFRRLFREYGFEWVINQDNVLEFSHPLFVRGRKQLLSDIKTRRKSFMVSARPETSESEIIEAEPGQRYSTRKRRRTKQFKTGEENRPDLQAGGESSFMHSHTNPNVQQPPLQTQFQIIPPTQLQKPEVRQPADTKLIQQSFVQNELTEEEFMHWISRQRKIDDARNKENIPQTISKDFVWMYYDNNGTRPDFDSNKQGELVLTPSTLDEIKSEKDRNIGIPCGMCKCCVAMSLLSADSSVTDDSSFMVDLDSDVEVTEIIVEEHDPEVPPADTKTEPE